MMNGQYRLLSLRIARLQLVVTFLQLSYCAIEDCDTRIVKKDSCMVKQTLGY